ncbi:MAG: DNA modification methylase, partial [Thermoplasmata archaeon]
MTGKRKDGAKLEIRKLPISKIAPAPYNPREISDKALEGLTASIREFGLVEPLVWNKRTKRLVAGHQRLKALQKLGATEAEVVVVDLPESREKALNVAL